jgi:hypothetical protein
MTNVLSLESNDSVLESNLQTYETVSAKQGASVVLNSTDLEAALEKLANLPVEVSLNEDGFVVVTATEDFEVDLAGV